MRVRLDLAARDEYQDAALYYLAESPRIAAAFVNQVETAIGMIRENPMMWRVIKADVRRYLVRQFPFGIYYPVESDEIVIWAIMHLHRKPDYWQVRRSR